jgi:sugar-specific transcriptional regulator TrmB
MEQINKILKNIGLTDTETSIYLAGLEYSSVGVNEIEKQTRIKRTTIYHALDTLMAKGLTAKKETPGKLEFIMTKPESIKRLIKNKISTLENQEKELEKVLPILNQRLVRTESKVRVSHFEGIEGVKLVVEEALYCRSRHWDIIAPAKNFFSEFDRNYADYFLNTRKARGLTARSLWEPKPITNTNFENRNPRLLPPAMHGKFKSVIILFDDKVAIISSLKELSAVLLQSQELHETMQAIFEGLWVGSSKYIK